MARFTKKMKQELRTNHFDTDDYLLNAEDVAETLSCSLPYVYKLNERGHIPAVRWPRLNDKGVASSYFLRFKKSDVMNFIENHKTL